MFYCILLLLIPPNAPTYIRVELGVVKNLGGSVLGKILIYCFRKNTYLLF